AEYNSIITWLQRDLPALKSQILLGDTLTASDIFESPLLCVALLYTEHCMFTASQNGVAPVVPWIANANDTVIILHTGNGVTQS
ncbi:fimbria/pilus outer membrane usher protein, partial [Escherichia coli]|uniref:fimbria/pilus outer membrane usher protein n=1 Tax=Escherichia coli TaxID=562 RepID=UPI001286D457